ncbi:hypothetical protein GF339_21050 [candidate division KSB3 bacterium]|uniref:Uncharacterized protein n=1 Tax=candidate division KSB3 bacterium TaxID=2044937 RepID=A0A9D5Q845_9BACT|nr:hypothetical protein [candidate division KSB3 bacterium]MBD3327088.1 hypothetical protein [candidate division KSB3 bacterium]
MEGAGGTHGGIGRFFLGLIMIVAGGYLFLNAIRVTQHFHLRYTIYSFGSVRLTSGMVLIPLIFGIGFIFYNYKNVFGWVLTGASLVMLGFGIISSIQFRLQNMSAFELIMILVLLIGGIGLFLSSFRTYDS